MIVVPAGAGRGAIASSIFNMKNVPGLEFWYSADFGVTTVGLNEITSILDQSGNGNTLENNGLVGTYPLLENSGINNKPAIDFNNTSDSFLAAANTITIKTLFCVFKPYSLLQYTALIECNGGGMYTAIDSNQFGGYYGTEVGFDTLAEEAQYICALKSNDGINITARINGSQYTDVGVGFTTTRSQITVGNADFLGQSSASYISELVGFTEELSDINMVNVERYLNAKYQIF